jgi:hypothetical protein
MAYRPTRTTTPVTPTVTPLSTGKYRPTKVTSPTSSAQNTFTSAVTKVSDSRVANQKRRDIKETASKLPVLEKYKAYGYDIDPALIKGYDKHGVPVGENEKQLLYYKPKIKNFFKDMGKVTAEPTPNDPEYATFQKSLKYSNAYESAFAVGLVEGFSPLKLSQAEKWTSSNQKKLSEQEGDEAWRSAYKELADEEKTTTSLTKEVAPRAFGIGETAGSFIKYAALYQAVGPLVEKIPALAKLGASKKVIKGLTGSAKWKAMGSNLLKELAIEGTKDAFISTPLVTLDALQSDKKGKELLGYVLKQAVIDVGFNAGIYGLSNAVPWILKVGKYAKNVGDVNIKPKFINDFFESATKAMDVDGKVIIGNMQNKAIFNLTDDELNMLLRQSGLETDMKELMPVTKVKKSYDKTALLDEANVVDGTVQKDSILEKLGVRKSSPADPTKPFDMNEFVQGTKATPNKPYGFNVGETVGQPTMYHGTPQKFDTFNDTKLGSNTEAFGTELGFHFTDDSNLAKRYSGSEGDIKKSRLNLKNTLDLTGLKDKDKDFLYKKLYLEDYNIEKKVYEEGIKLDPDFGAPEPEFLTKEEWFEDFEFQMEKPTEIGSIKKQLAGMSDELKKEGYDSVASDLFERGQKVGSEVVPIESSAIKQLDTGEYTDILKQVSQPTPTKNIADMMDIPKGEQLKIPLDDTDEIVKRTINPTSIPDGTQKPRQLLLDIKAGNRDVIPAEMVKSLEQTFYGTKGNIPVYREATSIVNADYAKSLADWDNLKEITSAEDSALGIALITKSIKEGNIDLANKLTLDLAEKSTNVARALQAMSIMKRLTPEGMLSFANRQVSRAKNPKSVEKVKKILDDLDAKKADTLKGGEGTTNSKKVVKEIQDALDGKGKNADAFLDGDNVKNINRYFKSNDIELSKLILESEGTRGVTGEVMAERIAQRFNLNNPDSKKLSDIILDTYYGIVQNKQTEYLDRFVRARTGLNIKQTKSIITKITEMYNVGGYKRNDVKVLLDDYFKIKNLDETTARNVVRQMKRVNILPEGTERDTALAQVLKYISDSVPASKEDKIKSILRISMLLNPKTMIRNPLGNTLLAGGEFARRPLAGGIDALVGLRTGQRTTSAIPDIGAYLKGQGEGLVGWAGDIKSGADTSPTRGMSEITKGKVFNNPLMNAVDGLTKNLLMIGDRPFYQGAFNERLSELKRLRKTTDITADMILDANQIALEKVYQNKSAFSDGAKNIQKALNGGKNFGIGNLLIPFTETPGNILRMAYQYSPFAMPQVIMKAMKGFTEGFSAQTQKEFVDLLSRSLTGAGIALTGYVLAKNKMAKGSSPKSAKVRQLMYDQGQYPFSVKTGDTWYSVDWAQPISMSLGMGIEIAETIDDEKSLGDALANAANIFFDQSFVQGLTSAMSGYNPAMGVLQSLVSSTSQGTPTLTAQAAMMSDDYMRDTSGEGILDTQANRIISRVPGLRQTLPERIDLFGNAVKQSQGKTGISKILDVFISPGKVSQENPDKIVSMVGDLYAQTKDSSAVPKIARTSITYGDTTHKLSLEEQREYQITMGNYLYNLLDASYEDLISMTTENRVRYIAEYIKVSDEYASSMFISNINSSPTKSTTNTGKYRPGN